jgi:SagB-type dehydrogenase family enzyme
MVIMKNGIYNYHTRTKHSPSRYASSLGYLDWATQPDPFRSYKGAKRIELPLALDNTTPPYNLIYQKNVLPAAPLLLQSLAQFFQFSLAISAYKSANGTRWALRCNASSGNLQPTEGYLILPPMANISDQTTIAHYSPKEHTLEIINRFDTSFWEQLPAGSFLVSLSSILWREVWKYGERAFRYTQLDAGHAIHALHVSAKILGWKLSLVKNCDITDVDKLFGLDKKERFSMNESESSDLLMIVSPQDGLTCDIGELLTNLQPYTDTIANTLSSSHHKWEIIDQIETLTHKNIKTDLFLQPCTIEHKRAEYQAKDVIMHRRSAQMMDASNATISLEQFQTILQSVHHEHADVHLLLYIHNVQGLKQGLYLYIRDVDDLATLQAELDQAFIYEKIFTNLYLLAQGDYKNISKSVSCNQDIAKDGAFCISMLAKFSSLIDKYDLQKYKELHYECGAIGQQLYLEATSLLLSATGIGCFLDDMIHELFGLGSNRYQVLYNFTIGRALIDSRVQTQKPYDER